MNKRTLRMELGELSYDIIIERGGLKKAGEYMALDRRVMIVTDSGVPKQYAETVAAQCGKPHIFTLEVPGESSKTLDTYRMILTAMLEGGFTRGDCVVAVGGGVIGDMAGFAAASYMRGVDFYNIPTTVLSQVDSSIGGKTGVNLSGVKNIVGAFYQPKRVLIDLDVLATLSARHVSNGLAEALKMAMTSDVELFELFEKRNITESMDEIVYRSLMIKKQVVEADEREQGLRKVLNFGHTLGHGIESHENGSGLFHGECVALGMIPMTAESLRCRLCAVLEKLSLPTEAQMDLDAVYEAMSHDKKAAGDGVTVVMVDEIGAFRFEKKRFEELRPMLKTLCKEQ